MTRAEQSAQTQGTILQHAHQLFAAHGYETVTLRTVAKAAGVSTGAIFAHWPNGKDELFTASMGRPPITDAVGVGYLAALYDIARACKGPGVDEGRVDDIVSVLHRLGLTDGV